MNDKKQNSISWIDINIPYSNQFDEDFNELDSFCFRNLNKSGTLIKLENEEIYLIGDLNEAGGVCDCCLEFSPDTIIAQYAKIIDLESIKNNS